MNRRTYLATSSAVVAGLAGCLSSGSNNGSGGETETASNPGDTDGWPPEEAIESVPEEREIDTESFERIERYGQQVPLVPVDVAHYWYQRQEARFVDARGSGQYTRSHITGAALSPADDSVRTPVPDSYDPTTDWPTDDPIVCYCGCPHHLSSQRAAAFIDDGYEAVYAIDEGFGAWTDNGYPNTGGEAEVASYELRGETDPADAGEDAWAVDEQNDQKEAGPIAEDGSYTLHLKFGDIPKSTPITVKTPSYEITRPLSAVTGSVVTGEME